MKDDTFVFERGDKVRDKVTQFEGICTGRADHISGCNTYALQPATLKDGAPQDQKWFDEPRLELVTAGALQWRGDTRAHRTGPDGAPQSTRTEPRR